MRIKNIKHKKISKILMVVTAEEKRNAEKASSDNAENLSVYCRRLFKEELDRQNIDKAIDLVKQQNQALYEIKDLLTKK